MNLSRLNVPLLVGHVMMRAARETGRGLLFFRDVLVKGCTPPYYPRIIFGQMMQIGYNSLPVVGLTAFFTGAVLALQIYIGGSRSISSEVLVANIVALGITRELGPVIAALMVAGRVSAAIAAEIGTMRVTEQIDALVTLSANPFRYLVLPRVLAGIITLPLLVAIADTIGIMGGYIVATQSLDFNSVAYVRNTYNFIEIQDVVSGLVKACAFGFIITFQGCYHGYYSRGGAQGVGQATTSAVVSASIFILAANYLLTSLIFTE